ncbi:hypothetical protein [Mycolicibacterium monacense]|uniref:hypothetical protein n=1 Tax=Mycolicibacterium monacense TaxID=85693 RepID=UPI0022EC6C63|nr:hypothetical protein [Mycolicibacterium monacense]
MAAKVFFSDWGPQLVIWAARSVSTAAIRVGSVIRAVRVTMARTSRSVISPAVNRAATFGFGLRFGLGAGGVECFFGGDDVDDDVFGGLCVAVAGAVGVGAFAA